MAWDEWNRQHIKKHKVTEKEVNEAYEAEFGRSQSYANRQAIYGRTKKDRLITVIVSFEKQKGPYVVTARDISSKEKRNYYHEKEYQTKANKTV